MRSEELDRALGKTLPSFDERMRRTLNGLQEKKQPSFLSFRRAVLLGFALVVVCSTAVALVSQGLNWYYSNRFITYQYVEPERYNAIINHLQSDVEQTGTEDDEIDIAVTEVSWAQEQKVMVVEITAVARDSQHMELHPMDNLDADAAYVGKGNLNKYPNDDEARGEHWLWTENGFGPVDEMIAPGKELLLINCGWVYLDGEIFIGDMSSEDSYVREDGSVHFVIEVRMDHLLQTAQAEDFENDQDARLAEKLQKGVEQGELTLTIPYTVRHYSEDDDQLYQEGRKGEISFTVKIR